MEPVTHVLTGACLARSGLNRKAAYATLTMAVAAEFPDIDTLWGLRGPVASFTHHRGITHTFAGIPFEAALLVGLVYALHRWRVRRSAGPNAVEAGDSKGRTPVTRPLVEAPVRWGWLYGLAVLALLSHILLDFTNNYGVRPFFPFNPHWYAGSIVFIFDPLLFCILLLALGLPWIFRLVNAEIGRRREPFRGRGLAQAALLLIGAYYGVRLWEHSRALMLARQQSLEFRPAATAGPSATGGPADVTTSETPAPAGAAATFLGPRRVLASPDPLSIFRWYTVTDFGPVYQLGQADTARGTFTPADGTQSKPASDAVVRAAEASALGRAYLDWSPMPFITVMHPSEPGLAVSNYVTFRDPRFMGDTLLLHSTNHTPLTGTVALDAGNHVLAQTMDGSGTADGDAVR